MEQRTNLVAKEKVGDCMVAFEKERVRFIWFFGMVLSEVMLRWRTVNSNVLLNNIII